ncbi:MAG: FAD-dependent oxidoreductase [Deltaproteobacteria bacterium]|nr:FAD-dependent oxidoreductase [Deltaproteobacteria bacterium]
MEGGRHVQAIPAHPDPRARGPARRGAKPSAPKRVLVIGAGVAGLEYARVAAEHGHAVTVWERKTEAGGQVELAAAPPGRGEFGRLKEYLVQACERLGVALEYGKDATASDVEGAVTAERFAKVVLATGARPITVPIPIEAGSAVVQAWDVLRGLAETGSRVVVVGGGAVGVETALLLAEVGTLDAETLRFLLLQRAEEPEELYRLLTQGTKEVTIVEMLETIGTDIGPSTRWSMLARLRQFGVTVRAGAKVLAVRDGGVWVEGPSGEERIEADTVVLALGSRPNDELAAELSGWIADLTVIGDAVKPKKMLDAIREAYEQATAV